MTIALVPNTATRAFEYIAERTCKVITPHGEATGCLIGDKVVATVFHIFQMNAKSEYTVNGVVIQHKEKEYAALFHNVKLESTARTDVVLLRIQASVALPFFNIFKGDLPSGTDVYFSGFPLSQSTLTHHKGMVSSVVDDGARFTIDGTIVHGNSGGPVAAESSGGFVLVGIITREVAQLSPEFHLNHFLINALAQQEITSGFTLSYTRRLPDGTEERQSTTRDEAIVKCLHGAMDNISTGIGKALHARCLLSLSQGEALPDLPADEEGIPVKKAVSGRTQSGTVQFWEHFPSNSRGPGPRGITFAAQGFFEGKIGYHFEPNPHRVSAYNRNQSLLYVRAAEAFEAVLRKSAPPPDTFTFEAYKQEFTATKIDQ
jgi:hypothetical protein